MKVKFNKQERAKFSELPEGTYYIDSDGDLMLKLDSKDADGDPATAIYLASDEGRGYAFIEDDEEVTPVTLAEVTVDYKPDWQED